MNCSVTYTGTSGSPPFACIDKVTRSRQHTITDPHIKVLDVQDPVSCTQLAGQLQILYGWLCISPNSEHIYTQLILSAKHHRRNFLAAYLVSNWPQCEYIFKDFLEQYMHPTPIPFPSHLLSTHHLPFKSTYHSNPLIIQTHVLTPKQEGYCKLLVQMLFNFENGKIALH